MTQLTRWFYQAGFRLLNVSLAEAQTGQVRPPELVFCAPLDPLDFCHKSLNLGTASGRGLIMHCRLLPDPRRLRFDNMSLLWRHTHLDDFTAVTIQVKEATHRPPSVTKPTVHLFISIDISAAVCSLTLVSFAGDCSAVPLSHVGRPCRVGGIQRTLGSANGRRRVERDHSCGGPPKHDLADASRSSHSPATTGCPRFCSSQKFTVLSASHSC